MSDTASQTLLAIDTSGPRLLLALAGNGFCELFVEDIAKGHAEILFSRLADLLARRNLQYEHLTRIAVTTGPGSFTGLRIGIAAARGLGLALSIPVIGVPNLFALSLAVKNGPVDVRLDARRDEFYVQRFSAPGVPESAATLISADSTAAGFHRPEATIVTDARVDIAVLARFAQAANPGKYPADPTYVRAADAKPQTTKLIARAETVR